MLQVSIETWGFPGTIKISPLVLVLEWISVHPASNPTQRSRPERKEPEMRVEVEGFGFGSPQSPPTPGRHRSAGGRWVQERVERLLEFVFSSAPKEIWPIS